MMALLPNRGFQVDRPMNWSVGGPDRNQQVAGPKHLVINNHYCA